MTLRFTKHAQAELKRRRIPRKIAEMVADNPDQELDNPPGRTIRQSRVVINGKEYLLRLVIERVKGDNVVVTAYRTSKIRKYWVEP